MLVVLPNSKPAHKKYSILFYFILKKSHRIQLVERGDKNSSRTSQSFKLCAARLFVLNMGYILLGFIAICAVGFVSVVRSSSST